MGAHVSIPMYQRTTDQRLGFEGEQCTACGTINFPPKAVCIGCRTNDEFESVTLSGTGAVYSYTVISPGGVPPEFADRARFDGEYVVAIIALEEGPRITAELTDVTPETVEIGMAVTGRIRRIYEEEGIVRYGFKFAPSE